MIIRSTNGGDLGSALIWNKPPYWGDAIVFKDDEVLFDACDYHPQLPVGQRTPIRYNKFVDDKINPSIWHDTQNKWIGHEHGVLDGTSIPRLLKCGATFLNADQWQQPMRATAHWTWEAGVESSTEERHAALRPTSGRWVALPKERCARVACRDQHSRDHWKVTSAIGRKSDCEGMCAQEFPGYIFDVPRSFYENSLVSSASIGKAEANEVIWVKYSLPAR